MKKHIFTAFAAAAVLMTACVDLDLTPKSQGSSENWYSTEQELQLSLNALYNPTLWNFECNRFFHTDRYSDDWSQRTELYDWLAGSVADDWSKAKNEWANDYKGIARANTILNSLEKTKDELSDATVQLYSGEAKFFRASFYTYLISALLLTRVGLPHLGQTSITLLASMGISLWMMPPGCMAVRAF